MEQETIFGQQYRADRIMFRYILDLRFSTFMKNYWDEFKQINIQNFSKIGKQQSWALENSYLLDSVYLIRDLYQDWIAHLDSLNKSHYDASYREFRKFLANGNYRLAQEPQDNVLWYSDISDPIQVAVVLALTFNWEHADIVREWRSQNKRKTKLQKIFLHHVYEKYLTNE